MFLLTSIAWPYRGLRYRLTEFECFIKGIRWQVSTFQRSHAQVKFFLKCIWNKSCSWGAFLKCYFELTSDTNIQLAFTFTCRESNHFWLFSLSRVDHALRPIFMFWLVKIWQVSSCGKFMQRLETCSLELELTEFCVILWCFKLSFSTWCTEWDTAVFKIVL